MREIILWIGEANYTFVECPDGHIQWRYSPIEYGSEWMTLPDPNAYVVMNPEADDYSAIAWGRRLIRRIGSLCVLSPIEDPFAWAVSMEGACYDGVSFAAEYGQDYEKAIQELPWLHLVWFAESVVRQYVWYGEVLDRIEEAVSSDDDSLRQFIIDLLPTLRKAIEDNRRES